jgi:glutathione-specific gamma-glutamylcyclotransferase
MRKSALLCRADLEDGSARAHYVRTELPDLAWSARQLADSLNASLKVAPPGDIWVFAYGSLIWNPIFPFAEKRLARIYNFHRSFCLWSRVGRGTRDKPGLVLGLDVGGSCRGVAYRITAQHAREELPLLWRREMVTGAYVPTWVKTRTEQGTVMAIAFVVRRNSHGYAGNMDENEMARHINSATGMLGPCSEYLVNTALGLREVGIHDALLERMMARCGCG